MLRYVCILSLVALANPAKAEHFVVLTPQYQIAPLVQPEPDNRILKNNTHHDAGLPVPVLQENPTAIARPLHRDPVDSLIPFPHVPDIAVYFEKPSLSDLLSGRLQKETPIHSRFSRTDRDRLAAFYGSRQNSPLWVANNQLTEQAKALIAQMQKAAEDGLDPLDYSLPILEASPVQLSQNDLSEAEVRLSALSIVYARDARGGRLEPRRLSSNIAPKLTLPSVEEVLMRLLAGQNTGEALSSFQPSHKGYQTLKSRLASVRAQSPGRPVFKLPKGPVLRVGMLDPRVPLIRARFGMDPTPMNTYDEQVASLVADFQRQKGLPVNGLLTPQTLFALNSGNSLRQESDLISNMERWRWLPENLGERYIQVNLPEYELRVVEQEKVVHEARVVIGKLERPTPVFSEIMDHVIVNPSWTVPPTILRKDILPGLKQDPNYAAKRGLDVFVNGKAVNPSQVDWSNIANVTVRQPPGERNALGKIKFMFPNDFAVYIHDTTHRELFQTTQRTHSSGCVRVENPIDLADIILGAQGWSRERLQKAFNSKGERMISLQNKFAVHLTYFTMSIDQHGHVQTFDDIYGLNQRIKTALGLRV